MSRKRRILKMAGVKRTTKRLVVTATITEYPNDKDDNKVPPDVHLNMDSGNLGVMDVRAILQRLLNDVQQKIDVEQAHREGLGDKMLNGVNLLPPKRLFPGGPERARTNGVPPHEMQNLPSGDTAGAPASAAGS